MKKLLTSVLSVGLGLLLVGCGNTSEETIRVGSKDFTENEIVAEVYSLALEDAGYHVERVFDVAGSLIHSSIINDEIDLYPEYTGTGLLVNLKAEVQTDPETVYETVKAGYEEEFDLTWLDYAPASDGQGIVVRTEVAEEYGIYTISDLQKNADKLRFASQGEVDQREDGIPMLEKVYGEFNWASSNVYDNGLKYEILKNDEADVTVAYTTEGNLVDEDFTLLEDDKQAWPPYNLAPVIRQDVLTEHEDIADILNKVNEQIDTETLIQLNAKVDLDKEEASVVAQEFYDSIK